MDEMKEGRREGRKGEKCFNYFHLLPGLLVMGPTVSQGFILGLSPLLFPLPAFPGTLKLSHCLRITTSVFLYPLLPTTLVPYVIFMSMSSKKTGKKLTSISKLSKLLALKSTPNLFLPLCCHHHQWHSYLIVLCWLTPRSLNSSCRVFVLSLAYFSFCCQGSFF